MKRLPFALLIAGALLGVLAFAATPAQAVTKSFSHTGGEQSFTVPSGVTVLHVLLIGGSGGQGGFASGGAAAKITADVSVTPGSTLFIEVGGIGEDSGDGGEGGFNGGASGGGGAGGGGGASDIRLVPGSSLLSLESRLIVAAGGGGAAGDGETSGGGAGGAAGSAGETSEGGNEGGGAGTESTGGGGGFGCSASGTGGELGSGGSGAGGFSANGGGGGAGGFYGGGGGGGGSSLVPVGGSLELATPGAEPEVILTYTEPPAVIPPAVNPPPVPNTVLGFHPPKKVKTTKAKAKVKFTFSSNVAGATFRCKLDKGAYAACVSPKRLKVKPGKHKFSVAAVKDGVADATPASFKFKVVKTS